MLVNAMHRLHGRDIALRASVNIDVVIEIRVADNGTAAVDTPRGGGGIRTTTVLPRAN